MIRHILTALICSYQSVHSNQNPLREQRIVGGENARDLNLTAPWYVFLSMKLATTTGQSTCGGTIISDKMILSAAHCFYNRRNEPEALIGLYFNRFDHPQNPFETGVDFVTRISNVLLRDDYDPYTHGNDIALVRLHGDDRFSHTTYVASLPGGVGSTSFIANLPSSNFDISSNSIYRAYGQGVTAEDGWFPTELQTVALPYVGFESCNSEYTSAEAPVDYTTMFCLGDLANGGIDSCQGDSGGPLMGHEDYGIVGANTVYGVVSWGIGCARPGFPGIYAKVSHYVSWIETQENEFEPDNDGCYELICVSDYDCECGGFRAVSAILAVVLWFLS